MGLEPEAAPSSKVLQESPAQHPWGMAVPDTVLCQTPVPGGRDVTGDGSLRSWQFLGTKAMFSHSPVLCAQPCPWGHPSHGHSSSCSSGGFTVPQNSHSPPSPCCSIPLLMGTTGFPTPSGKALTSRNGPSPAVVEEQSQTSQYKWLWLEKNPQTFTIYSQRGKKRERAVRFFTRESSFPMETAHFLF